MPAVYGWPKAPLWAAVEIVPPYRLIGLYYSQCSAMSHAYEFGTPSTIIHVESEASANQLAMSVRARREGR